MFFKNNLPALLWSLVILALTITPGRNVPRVEIEGLDKVVHFLLFGILMFLTMRGFTKEKKRITWTYNPAIVSFTICLFYGILIEFIQLFVPGRSFSPYDIAANSAGILVAYFIFYFFSIKKTP